jgi:hypothetical protein
MTDNDKLLNIAAKLLEKTQHGSAHWQETADEDTFQSSLTDSAITIRCASGGQYSLAIINDKGREVAHLIMQGSLDDAGVLVELYDAAKREALQVDQAIDDVLKGLSK